MLDEALRWNGLGVSCIPFWQRGKGFDKRAARQRGFNKLSDFTKRLPSIEDLEFWFSGRRKLALMTKPDFISVDFDSLQSYYQFYALYRSLNQTFTVKTRRGYHFYFFLDEPISKPIETIWEKTDLKSKNETIITYGAGYQVINDSLPLRLENIFALPFVKEVKRTVSPTKKKSSANFSFRGCQGSVSNPIKTIKSNLSISRYLADLGHELKPLPNNRYITNCPIHNDEKPSFWIDENTSTCNCYRDDCKRAKSYDVLDLHQKLNGCNLPTAINQLANSLGF